MLNTGRRPPHCRTCLQPMRGHRAGQCTPSPASRRSEEVSKTSDWKSTDGASSESGMSIDSAARSYASPPPSPSPTPFPSKSSISITSSEASVRRHLIPPRPVYPQQIISQPSFELPETGPFYRRNPNYVAPFVAPPLIPRPSGSLVSTVLVGSDGKTISLNDRASAPSSVATGEPGPSRRRHRNANARAQEIKNLFSGASLNENYDYWPGNAASIASRSSSEGHVSVMTAPNRESVFAFLDTLMQARFLNDLMCIVNRLWSWSPHFVVCVLASILGGYINNKYL
ncbi:hypothetical protein BDZ97DRAFT_238065 [Flammula alnicola]|nr:hypothetical protein BDZ97DRAFT_238065 [Flammula alnicola]